MASISSDNASSYHTCSDSTSFSHMSSNQQTVEFCVSSLWSWLPAGIKRVIEHLESFDLVGPFNQRAATPQLDTT